MALITIHRKRMVTLPLPYWITINGIAVALMKGKDISFRISDGEYNIGVRLAFRFFKWNFYLEGETHVKVTENDSIDLLITDKEKWWNLLFDIDILFMAAKLFFELPSPWNIVYEIISNGFFIIWLVRIWMIRKKYFQLK